MRSPTVTIAAHWLFICTCPVLSLSPLSAQLVWQGAAPDAQQSPAASSSADPPASSTPTGTFRASQEIQLTGDSLWADTGIDVQAGERVSIIATGTMRYSGQLTDIAPVGAPRGFKDLLRDLPFNGAGRGALIGRIGDEGISQPFLIGANRQLVSPIAGRLSVGINQLSDGRGDGTYTVQIKIFPADSHSRLFVARTVVSMPDIDGHLFAKIPRRVSDKAGNPGDMVNFLIIGSQDEMEKVFVTAGWVKVDANVKDALLHGLLESISKESYLNMPMSPLYLFGRQQDYGWAHAEPISVAASRNHLRIWKAPMEINGQTLWVGAATHDVGFEKDQRNNGITHKIDPDVDLERDYVEKTLASTGMVAEVTHILPANPMKEAKTATGGNFHSNGQVLVLKLGEAAQKP
ncbi:MAG TPA: LssY C-terminal domain-containing protein [Candidatus Solibacter sp.]|nr:LssY C-terminal domain-containing protein [Candidatus Solibacter sp.]